MHVRRAPPVAELARSRSEETEGSEFRGKVLLEDRLNSQVQFLLKLVEKVVVSGI